MNNPPFPPNPSSYHIPTNDSPQRASSPEATSPLLLRRRPVEPPPPTRRAYPPPRGTLATVGPAARFSHGPRRGFLRKRSRRQPPARPHHSSLAYTPRYQYVDADSSSMAVLDACRFRVDAAGKWCLF